MLVDCDFWPQKAVLSLLAPYLPESRRAWLRLDEPGGVLGGRYQLPESPYFVAGPALRETIGSAEAAAAASAYLDRLDVAAAVVNPGAAAGVAGIASPLLATEVARAVNEWTAAVWLEADDRLLGSIVIAAQDPAAAAAEIRRAGADRRMVQVLLADPPRLLGDRVLAPIYEAAVELSLPVNLQAGGSPRGVGAVAQPFTQLEAFLAWESAAQPHLVSLVVNGTFDRFPGLRLVVNGFGVAWLPALLWRLDLEARLGRVELPPLDRRPGELLREHVRFTTAPLELADELARLLELIDARGLLMHASGPLRTGGDADLADLDAVPEDWRAAVAGENARAVFPGLPASASP